MKKKEIRPLSREERWLLVEPFERVLSKLERYDQLFQMCKAGISQLASKPDLIKALKKWTNEPDEEHMVKLENAERIAKASRQEQSENFPMLYSQAIVTLSNFLDTAMEDFLILWFQHRKEILTHRSIRSVQVRAADYELLDPNDRMRVIVREVMSKSVTERQKHGVERFEIMLRLIGIKKSCHRNMLVPLKELRAFRNAIVHADQRADKKFCEACPWLVCPNGRLLIDEVFYRRMSKAAICYLASVLERVREVFFPITDSIPESEPKSSGLDN
jgi:hypothetical protein